MDESESLGVVSFLRSLGASEDQIDVARRERRLPGLAADLVLAVDPVMSARELADRVGTDVGRVSDLWRTLGVAVPRVDVPFFSEGDGDFTTSAIALDPTGPNANELFRVLGVSLARVAESAVSLFVQTVESQLDTPDADLLVWAQVCAATTSTALELGNSLGALLAHHLRDAIDRQRVAQADVSDRHLYRMAVGFVDLVGFTPLAQHSSAAGLLDLISRFESRAFHAAALHGGRVIKHIGDEVMLAALDPAAACAVAHAITRVADDDGFEPRGGVAFGDVISRHGDYYGPVVNLAARLADLAIPGEILVDEMTAHAVGSAEFSFRPAGRRLLKGFDTPIEVFSVVDVGLPERQAKTSGRDREDPSAPLEE